MTNNRLYYVFTKRIANQLLENGYQMVRIENSLKGFDKLVFAFPYSKEIVKFVEDIMNEGE